MIELVCAQCGKTFKRYGKKYPTGLAFCNNDCYQEYHRSERTYTCAQCGKVFKSNEHYDKKPRHTNLRFCCRGHYFDYVKEHGSLFFENARDLNGVCENCGKRIHLTNTQKVKNKHSFCSRSCASQYNMKNKNRKFREDLNCTCTYCGKKFHRKKSAINKTNFCSKDCHTKYLKAQRVTFTCEMCGKVFDVPPSDAEHTRFCSRKCADDYQRRFCLHTKCAYCGNPIRVKSNTQARNKTGNYFCSNRCVGKFFSGENSPAYTGNSDVMKVLRIYFALHQRQQVFVRDKKICQVCGGRATVVHHKYPLFKIIQEFQKKHPDIDITKNKYQVVSMIKEEFPVVTDLNNLMALCEKCHHEFHKTGWQKEFEDN